MSSRYDPKTRGAGAAGGGLAMAGDRSLTPTERIRQQEELMARKRRERQLAHGSIRVGGAVTLGARGAPSGFVPKPPPSSGVNRQDKSSSSLHGSGPSSAASALRPANDGRIGSSRGATYRSGETASSGRSTNSYQYASAVSNNNNSEVLGLTVKMASETEKKLAAGNLRGAVDFTESRMVHDDSEDDLPEVIDATDSTRVGGASRRAEASRMDSQDPDDEEQRGGMAISPSGGSSQAAAESASPASGSGSIGSGEATSNLPNIGIAQPNEGDSGSKMTPAMSSPEMESVAEFLNRPAPAEYTVRCRFTRQEGIYYLHMELPENEKRFLLAAKKRQNARSTDFLISLDATDITRSGSNYVGKLQGNLTGTEFTVYDSGANPTKSRALPDLSNVREELAAVHYGKNVLGIGGPRKMAVIIPHLNQNNERVPVIPKNDSESLMECFKADKLGSTRVVLENKLPTWSAESESFVLNFNGRVTKASVKNFQIVHPEDQSYIVMQFGRVADNQFTLDYSYPLCGMQAFGIALSSCCKNWAQ